MSVAAIAAAALCFTITQDSLPPEIRLLGAFVLFVALPGFLAIEVMFGREAPARRQAPLAPEAPLPPDNGGFSNPPLSGGRGASTAGEAPGDSGASGARPADVEPLERGLLALGCGYVLAELLALLLYATSRPLAPHHLPLAAVLLNAALLLALLRRSPHPPIPPSPHPTLPRSHVPTLALLTLAAIPLRLYNLGYSEFQGDEAKVVLRGMAVLQGVPDALIAHRKPPGEVLLAALFSGGLGVVTELPARLPFALAGVAAVYAVYVLGRAMFGPAAGLAAGLLIAVNGYWVAFGRILQYQGVGLLLDTLAVLCLYRFATGHPARRGYAVLGGLLLAGAGLTALSAVFLLPVAAAALGRSLRGPTRAPPREVALWLWPLAPLLPAAIVLYGPLAGSGGDRLDLASIWPYIGPRLGEGRPYFNLPAFLTSVNHYTSSLYLVVVLGAGAIVLMELAYRAARAVLQSRPGAGWDRGRPRPPGERAGTPTVPAGTPRSPSSFHDLRHCTAAEHRLAATMATVWLLGPLLTHLTLIRIPGTHWREVFPGLVLLLGAAAAAAFTHWAKPTLSRSHALTPSLRSGLRLVSRSLALALAAVFLAATAHFVYVAWVHPWPEYQLNYPLYRHPLDWSGRTARDPGGTFGDVRHFGWKAIGVLLAEGRLSANYASNDPRQAEAAWYLKAAPGCPDSAELYARLPLTPRERRAIERSEPIEGWSLFGRVLTGEHPTMALYTRRPPPGGPHDYPDAELAARYDRDRDLSSPWHPVGQLYRPDVDARRAC